MTKIKNGDFVELEYTGKTSEEGIIFDTTDEKIAKESDVYNPNYKYGPVTICMGQKHILPGIDKALEGKETGKEYDFRFSPEDAFGKKNAKLIQLIPTTRFLKDKVTPMPGLQVDIDGTMGIIKTVGGGRTLVDFNHPLSGKTVSYKIKTRRIINDDSKKVGAVIKNEMNIADATVDIKDGIATISSKQEFPEEINEPVGKRVQELIPTVKKTVFKVRKQ